MNLLQLQVSCAVAVAFLSFGAVVLPAQVPSPGRVLTPEQLKRLLETADVRDIEIVSGSVVPFSSADLGKPEKKDSEEKEPRKKLDQKLLKAIQGVRIDRRPSVILSEWSKPDLLAVDDDPKLELPKALGEAPAEPEPGEPLVEPTPPPKPDPEAQDAAPDAVEAAYSEAKEKFDVAHAAFVTERDARAAAQKEFTEKKAAFEAATAEYSAKKARVEAARRQRQADIYRRAVTLGHWDRVGEVLELFPYANAKVLYMQLVQKLSNPPKTQGASGQLTRYRELNEIDFDDVVGLIAAAPRPDPDESGAQGGVAGHGVDSVTSQPAASQPAASQPVASRPASRPGVGVVEATVGVATDETPTPTGRLDDALVNALTPLIRRAMTLGNTFDNFVERLRFESARPEEERVIDRRLGARLLSSLARNLEVGEFLESRDELVAANDREGLNLLARHHVAKYRKERDPDFLVAAWDTTMLVLDEGELADKEKAEGLRRAVRIAPQIRGELGQTWLQESFTTRPDRGMEILATIGREASEGMVRQANDTEYRLNTLKLLSTAATSLVDSAPERAESWSDELNLLAEIWRREALHSYEYSEATSSSPAMRRDSYGNFYYSSYGYRSVPVKPLDPGDLLEIRPVGLWSELLSDDVKTDFDSTVAELYLKLNEDDAAFPYIEKLAATDKAKAEELAREFLRVWINNHNPNQAENYSSIYSFNYGYSQRASGIPLTRSKQERNLNELREVVARLRSIEGIEIDSQLLMRAFTTCHSQAEVYRVDRMIEVFGSLDELDADMLAGMAQTMRSNLGQLWRSPAVQRDAKTKRKQKDIEAEVKQGYAIAQQVLAQAIRAHPDSWRLRVARGAMIHDLNNYRNEIQKNAEFAGNRRNALAVLESAVDAYVGQIDRKHPEDWTVDAFDMWFYSALGATDLAAVSEESVLANVEIPKIKERLGSLEGEIGDKHRTMFATRFVSRLTAVNPGVKTRYLKAGFEIIGDHPVANEAREIHQYYKDLVTEIELVAGVEGSADVGMDPFLLKIDIRSTKDMERESGGFNRYLQNQANGAQGYYNNGRPPENYRDKFEESLRGALGEQFEIRSLTFNSEDVVSRADERYGWRRTPYAYAMLKAKGPEVDRVPPIKIDMDFLDTSGYVVLPIMSKVVPIDASAESGDRAFRDVRLTQILDERKAEDEGVLKLEVRAEATGLVPEFDKLMELPVSDFTVEDIEDQGAVVNEFGDDRDSLRTERTFVLTMKAKEGLEKGAARRFSFAQPRADHEVLYQRYDDADLVAATRDIELLGEYPSARTSPLWLIMPLILGLAGFAFWLTQPRRKPVVVAAALRVPDEVTPFTALGFLRKLRDSGRVAQGELADLERAIGDVEHRHFSAETVVEGGDLETVLRYWSARA